MKKTIVAVTVSVLFVLLVSCSTMEGAMSGALSSIGADSVSAGAAAAGETSKTVEFQSGELLCSADSRPMTESVYHVAKIITPASAATKNQAEALWIAKGSKEWVNYAVGSRKASKDEMSVGTVVFYLYGWDGYDTINAESYRKEGWKLGYITSVDDLYKNQVEISGNLYNVNYLRIPTDPVN